MHLHYRLYPGHQTHSLPFRNFQQDVASPLQPVFAFGPRPIYHQHDAPTRALTPESSAPTPITSARSASLPFVDVVANVTTASSQPAASFSRPRSARCTAPSSSTRIRS
ncbi:hypothetical protein BC567DRAFT_221953 [Phyllosticta citribraziliensis]